MIQDIRFAFRLLRNSPGFVAVVVFTLSLGIGANTAIFSIVNALLIEKPPYPQPERIGTVYCRVTGSLPMDTKRSIDGEQWELLRDNVPDLLAAVAGWQVSGVNLQANSHVQYLRAGRVSSSYFDVLGLRLLLGRSFSQAEDRPQGPKAAVLSYHLWQTIWSGDRSVLGSRILLKGEPYTVVGVLPKNATTPPNAEIYTSLQPGREGEGRGTNYWAILRLRKNATWEQADSEINRAWAQTPRVQSILRTNPNIHIPYHSVPLQKSETKTLGPQVLALMLAAGCILLIACANLAGMALVRMLRRSNEIATRLAFGATGWQIQRQLWIENLILALVGGTVGIGVGSLALRGLLKMLPANFLPVADVPLDNRVLAFTLCVAMLTSILFGMLPAFATGGIGLRSSMSSRGVISAGSIRLRQSLIAGEVAITVVLLAAAGLLVRTLVHLETMPPGFNPAGVITAKASLDNMEYYEPAKFRKLLNESLAAMRQIPAVQHAAVGLTLPYERPLISGFALRNGKQGGQQVQSNEVYVTPEYFDALQIPLLSGRAFTDADGPGTEHVAIVNRTFARKFLGVENPLEMYLNKDMRIVGVVEDTVLSSAGRLNEGTAPLTDEEAVYIPAAQVSDRKSLALIHGWYQPSWIVRCSQPTAGLTEQMQRALASVDPNLPFAGFYSMDDLMAGTLATQRVEVALLTAMASLALLLSALGISALVANIVAQRSREVGIRMALGSTTRQAMVQIGRAGVSASALGLVLGLILCGGVLRLMRSLLFGVGVYDVPSLLGVVVVLFAVTLIASAVPALRVAKIDPAEALRYE